MRKTCQIALLALGIGAVMAPQSVAAAGLGRHTVDHVEGDDLLKMRAGPGTGYVVVLGLPNGTMLQVHGCEPMGHTQWCEVSLDQARNLRGWVSAAYLEKR